MTIKIIGCFLIVGASYLTGFQLSRSLHKRKDFLKSFGMFLTSLATNLRYNSEDIFTLVSSCARVEEMDIILPEKNKQAFEDAWHNKIKEIPKDYALTKSDKELLICFGFELGKTDTDGQLKHIELYKSVFEKQLLQAEEDVKSKSKLYQTMGLFIGITISLMII